MIRTQALFKPHSNLTHTLGARFERRDMKNIFWKKCHSLYSLYIGYGIVIGRYEKCHIGILLVSADKKIEVIGLYRYRPIWKKAYWSYTGAQEGCARAACEVWVTFERGLSKVWARFERGLSEVWASFEQALSEVWARFERDLSEVWARFEQSMSEAWARLERGLSEVWASFERALSKIWARFSHLV